MMHIRTLTAVFLLSLHEKVAFAFPGGTGGCDPGPADGTFHLSRPQTSGSLSEGEFEVLLNDSPLSIAEVSNFPFGEMANLTLRSTGQTEFLGYLFRLNLFDDDTTALTPDSSGQVSSLCDAQSVSSSTNINAAPKALVTSMLATDVLTELILDVTVVVGDTPSSSVRYHSTFTIRQANTQGCSICGDGMEVTASDEIFTFPGQPAVPCGELERAGENGQIPLAQCQFLPPLLSICECASISADTSAPSSPAPVVTPTDPPTMSMPVMPDTPAPAVSTCGGRNDPCTRPSNCCSNSCQRRPGVLEGFCLSNKSASKANQKLGGNRGGTGGSQAKR